jgi:hypothetical protein
MDEIIARRIIAGWLIELIDFALWEDDDEPDAAATVADSPASRLGDCTAGGHGGEEAGSLPDGR